MKKKIAAVVGIILVLVLVIGFIICQPYIETAKTISKAESFSRFNFDIELNINEDKLSDKQISFVNRLSGMLGVSTSSILSLHMEGSLYDDTAYAVVSSEAINSPITKVYIRDKVAYINVKMIYELIKSNITEASPLLNYLLPDWSYGEYITTEQLEVIFDVDFEELFTIKTQELIKEPSFIECFVALISIDKEKNEDSSIDYNVNWKSYDISFNIEEVDEVPAANFIAVSSNDSKAIESFNGKVIFNLSEPIVMPDSIVGQNTVDGFAKIWSVLVDILDRF